jgi:hypothetical protein
MITEEFFTPWITVSQWLMSSCLGGQAFLETARLSS